MAKTDHEPTPPDGGGVTQLRVESELVIEHILDPKDACSDQFRESLELGQGLFRSCPYLWWCAGVLASTTMQVRAAPEFAHHFLATGIGLVRIEDRSRDKARWT